MRCGLAGMPQREYSEQQIYQHARCQSGEVGEAGAGPSNAMDGVRELHGCTRACPAPASPTSPLGLRSALTKLAGLHRPSLLQRGNILTRLPMLRYMIQNGRTIIQ